jgi:hypothetical protein
LSLSLFVLFSRAKQCDLQFLRRPVIIEGEVLLTPLQLQAARYTDEMPRDDKMEYYGASELRTLVVCTMHAKSKMVPGGAMLWQSPNTTERDAFIRKVLDVGIQFNASFLF